MILILKHIWLCNDLWTMHQQNPLHFTYSILIRHIYFTLHFLLYVMSNIFHSFIHSFTHIYSVDIKTDHTPSTKIIQANSDSNKKSSFLSSRSEICSVPQHFFHNPNPYQSVTAVSWQPAISVCDPIQKTVSIFKGQPNVLFLISFSKSEISSLYFEHYSNTELWFTAIPYDFHVQKICFWDLSSVTT